MSVDSIQFTKVEIKALKYIFKHFKDKYNARQLAKSLSLNHAHISKLCSSLAEKKLLEKEKIGNSIYYRFNYGNSLALKFMEYILSLEEQEFPKWLNVLAYNLKKFKEIIKLGCVFGSSIKSDNFNDIDILLVYDPGKQKEIKTIKDSIRKAELVERPIRYIELTEKDIKKNKDDEILYKVLSENIIFHNAGKFIELVRCLR
ncbi:MAG: hypothetical protein KJ601_06040 [Nanoarchaeota archaeon]|nr:hypothetical protein [Nanoarchaeota archaeon]MBU1703788.1 hypothetical protein [Nanoarchaeota archaeon]